MGGISLPSSVRSVNGMTGDVVIPAGAVDSVNGQIGDVVLTAADVGAIETVNGVPGPDVVLTATEVGALSSSVSAETALAGSTVDLAVDPDAVALTLFFRVMSTNGTQTPLLRLLNDVGNPVIAGYNGGLSFFAPGPTTLFLATGTSFPLWVAPHAALVQTTGVLTLTKVTATRWYITGTITRTDTSAAGIVTGTVDIGTAQIGGLRLTTDSADVFDAGFACVSSVV